MNTRTIYSAMAKAITEHNERYQMGQLERRRRLRRQIDAFRAELLRRADERDELKAETAARIRAKIYAQLHGEFFSLETANEEVTRVANIIAAEIDAKDAELAELRATLRTAEARITGFIAQEEDARAEIARLKPKAEAWDAFEAYQELRGMPRDTAEAAKLGADRWEALQAAGARAREAKMVDK